MAKTPQTPQVEVLLTIKDFLSKLSSEDGVSLTQKLTHRLTAVEKKGLSIAFAKENPKTTDNWVTVIKKHLLLETKSPKPSPPTSPDKGPDDDKKEIVEGKS
jgi:hypothetical protein